MSKTKRIILAIIITFIIISCSCGFIILELRDSGKASSYIPDFKTSNWEVVDAEDGTFIFYKTNEKFELNRDIPQNYSFITVYEMLQLS